jgi:hypothetical protein
MPRTILAAVALVTLGAPNLSWACGGFFCSSTPVNQSAEKIVFYLQPDGVEVIVQVSTAGTDATDFAWVVPVQLAPDQYGTGSQAALDTIAQLTTPQFRLDVQTVGNCHSIYFPGEAGGPDRNGVAPTGTPMGPTVQVVSQQSVGPYDSVLLKSDDPNALVQWLRDNQFRISDAAAGIIPVYVAEHSLFVAYKLKADATTQDIVPITLHFPYVKNVDGTALGSCIPLRLTAIAATNDMEVLTFVLASAQAVPTNFFRVLLNLAKIDWINDGLNYDDVLKQAVSEAGGNAFATEYAGGTSQFKEAFFSSRYDTATLSRTTDPAAYVQQLLLQGFPRNGQMRSFLEKWIPEPDAAKQAGITEQSFYNCLECYQQYVALVPFNAAAATADLDTTVLEPLREFQHAVDSSAYLTRLRTFISPAQMTIDPTFAITSNLPDVSNIHVAQGLLQCGMNGAWGQSPISITYEGGGHVTLMGDGQSGYNTSDLMQLPAALLWYQDKADGSNYVAGSNVAAINGIIASHNNRVDGGCAAAPGGAATTTGAGFILLMSVVGGALGLRRRRAAGISR